MFRRLFWLSIIAGVGYVLWRWARQQSEPLAAPAMGYAGAQRPLASAPEAPAAAPLGAAEPAVPEAPAAQPSGDLSGLVSEAAISAGDLPSLVSDATLSAGDLSGLVSEAAASASDLSGLVGADAGNEGDLSGLVGDAVTGEATVDLAPLVSPEASAGAPALGQSLTNINTADEEALIALPGIGPVLARRIIAYRTERGPFTSVEQLVEIQGIGPRNIKDFQHLVTV